MLNEKAETGPAIRERRKESLQETPLGERTALATTWERLKLGTAIILSGD
jgi:hypothetical protein